MKMIYEVNALFWIFEKEHKKVMISEGKVIRIKRKFYKLYYDF